jgi:predicted nucleic acid-binding protein
VGIAGYLVSSTYSAIQAKADCIITRNKGDYADDKIPVLTPEEFLASFEM